MVGVLIGAAVFLEIIHWSLNCIFHKANNIPLVLRIVDSDRDYDRLYHRINQNNYQEGDKKAMIVSVEYIFNPSKKQ